MPKNYLPDLRYIPGPSQIYDTKTPVAKGYSMGSFFPGKRVSGFTQEELKSIHRHLMPQGEICRSIYQDQHLFGNHQLRITGAVYKPEATENNDANSVLGLKERGRVVSYKVRNKGTNSNSFWDIEATFAFAVHLVKFYNFEKLTLDWDTIENNPDTTSSLAVTVQMPQISEDYVAGRFTRTVVTTFNDELQGTGELIDFSSGEIQTVTADKLDTDGKIASSYIALGGSHAQRAQQAAGSPWTYFNVAPSSAFNTEYTTTIKNIKPGSTVALFIGADDEASSFSAQEIATEVSKILALAKVSGITPTIMLFPTGTTGDVVRKGDIRRAIKNAPRSGSQIIDLDDSEFVLAIDGRFLENASYASALGKLI